MKQTKITELVTTEHKAMSIYITQVVYYELALS